MTQKFPEEAFTNHIAILGKTGSGKTTAAKGFVEGLIIGGKRRVCAVDPTGVWWGLRLLKDGKTAGLSVIIFGGAHADVPIDEHAGARLAEIIAAGTFSCVIDTSLMTVGARTRFFTEFAEALFRANTKPLHLVIDEAHVFAPQGRVPDPQSGRMVHATNNLVSGGRSRGLRIMLISQRPAKLHKDSLTQVETLIAMRLIAPQDRAAVEAWIGEWGDPKQGREMIASLPSLPRGQGWVWAPELGVLTCIQFPKIQTFDSSQTPEDGFSQAPVDLSTIDIDSIRKALAEVQSGKDDKSSARANVVLPADIKALEERWYKKGFDDGYKNASSIVTNTIESSLNSAIAYLRNEIGIGSSQKPESAPTANSGNYKPVEFDTFKKMPPASPGRPELRVLRVLAARHPARLTRAQWATLAGMKRTGGTWLTYVSRLRTAGYLEEDGNLVSVSAAGMKAAGPIEIPPPGSVIAQWKNALGTGPSRMIDALIAAHPNGMDRANLADRVGMKATGGTFLTYLSRLKTNGLVDISGRKIVASHTLFLDQGKAA